MPKTIDSLEEEARVAKAERDEAVSDGRSRGRTVYRKITKKIDELLVEYATENAQQHSMFNDGAMQSLSRLKAKLADDARDRHVDGSEI